MAKKKQSFEQALRDLEEVVAQLENGSLPLDACLEQYERGIRLAELCMHELDAARQRIEKLRKTKDGGFATAPFEGPAGEDEAPADEPGHSVS